MRAAEHRRREKRDRPRDAALINDVTEKERANASRPDC